MTGRGIDYANAVWTQDVFEQATEAPAREGLLAQRLDGETDEAFRKRVTACFSALRPPTPAEIVKGFCAPDSFTITEDREVRTVDIDCPSITCEDAYRLAGAFAVDWRVTINGRRSWDIIREWVSR